MTETRVHTSAVIRKTPAELFALWRDLSVVARVLRHIEAVERIDGRRTRWSFAAGPPGLRCEVEVTEERENDRIVWTSATGAAVGCAGSVRFTPVEGGAATELTLDLAYDAADAARAPLGAALGDDLQAQVDADTVRLKEQLESGRMPTKDVVQTASEQSFPASDPPSWTAR